MSNNNFLEKALHEIRKQRKYSVQNDIKTVVIKPVQKLCMHCSGQGFIYFLENEEVCVCPICKGKTTLEFYTEPTYRERINFQRGWCRIDNRDLIIKQNYIER